MSEGLLRPDEHLQTVMQATNPLGLVMIIKYTCEGIYIYPKSTSYMISPTVRGEAESAKSPTLEPKSLACSMATRHERPKEIKPIVDNAIGPTRETANTGQGKDLPLLIAMHRFGTLPIIQFPAACAVIQGYPAMVQSAQFRTS